MTKDEMDELKIGDSVRNRGGVMAYVIIRLCPSIVAIRSIEITNPPEWELVERPRITEKTASDKINDVVDKIRGNGYKSTFDAGRDYGLTEALKIVKET